MLEPSFPQTLLHVPFPFVHCPWHISTVINHSYEYDYMLSSVNPPGESSDTGVVLEVS